MTPQLEKVFFNFILENRKYYDLVKPNFFRNSEIKFVYDIIRKYMTDNREALTPSPRQILDMVNLNDKEGVITKDILKSILNVNLLDYDRTNFIEPKFNAWVLSNRLKSGVVDIVDESRNLDGSSELDEVSIIADKIKNMVEDMTSTKFVGDDDDLGSDFDDVENHIQDSSKYKVNCGISTLNHILGGGWDIGTLSILMAETNNGKSLWMQNLSVLSANLGYNVLYITLEMSERKVMKRLGAMRLKIPINEYDEISKDTDLIKKRINNLSKTNEGGIDLFDKKVGKIYTKFWAAGTATVNDFDNYIQKMKEKKGISFDMVVVDYITLIAPPKGMGADSLYIKGKHLAEGLRALAAKYKCPFVTAIQVSKDAWGATDITLESIPESKAIAECGDAILAIIRDSLLKRQNQFRLKLLKQRDGDFSKANIMIDLNPTYLTLENDRFLDV